MRENKGAMSHSRIRNLLFVLVLLVVIQNILWGNYKYYIKLFGRDISLLDGVLTIVVIGLFFVLTFRIEAFIGFAKTLGSFYLFLGYLVFSIIFIGFEGKGIVQFVQASIQLVFCFFGYYYAKSYADSRNLSGKI